MIHRFVAPVIGMIALSLGSMGIASAQNSIGLQFVGGGGGGTTKALAPADKAGVPAVAQTHWNPLQGIMATPQTSITTDDGKPVTVKVTYKTPNTWSSGLDGTTSADNALMAGYLDTGDSGDDDSVSQVKVSGIPFAKYDVYVYVYGDVPTEHRQGAYKIGTTTLKVTDFGAFTGTYKAPTDKDPTGNYIVFKGITGDTFIVTGIPGDSDGTPRAPINAVQIVKE